MSTLKYGTQELNPVVNINPIDDSTASDTSVYSSNKVESLLSNPNLLDNPWFTVNQRGVADGDVFDGKYAFDRWKITLNNSRKLVIGDGYVGSERTTTGSGNGISGQLLSTPLNLLSGQSVTFSIWYKASATISGLPIKLGITSSTDISNLNKNTISSEMISNNTSGWVIESVTYTSTEDITITGIYIQNLSYSKSTYTVGDTIYIRACKLELGSVSTLANDVAPNYTTELLKCQRYYQRIYSGDIGVTFVITDGRIEGTFNTKTEMRKTPSVALTCTNVLATNDDYQSTVTGPTLSWTALSPHNVLFNFSGFTAVSSAVPVRLLPVLTDGTLVPSNSIFELSADL